MERVLNGRGGVRAETAEKVIAAARKLDWPGRLPDRHRGIFRIEVILVRPETAFFARLAKAFRRIGASLDPAIQIHVTFLEEADPAAIAKRIADTTVQRSGLVISSPSHRDVSRALLHVRSEGLPVVQVVTRNIDQADYVGIDNLAAGRMAGMMMTRLNPARGRVVALCHGQVYQVHSERMAGFSNYLATHPVEGLHFDYVIFGRDDRDISADRLTEALRRWPDLVGVYNCGGGNDGLLDVLKRSGREIFFIGHELDQLTKDALQAGSADVIFDQLPEAQARRATDLLLWRIGLTQDPVDNPLIRFTTITAENV